MGSTHSHRKSENINQTEKIYFESRRRTVIDQLEQIFQAYTECEETFNKLCLKFGELAEKKIPGAHIGLDIVKITSECKFRSTDCRKVITYLLETEIDNFTLTAYEIMIQHVKADIRQSTISLPIISSGVNLLKSNFSEKKMEYFCGLKPADMLMETKYCFLAYTLKAVDLRKNLDFCIDTYDKLCTMPPVIKKKKNDS